MFEVIVTLICALFIFVYTKLSIAMRYWNKKGVKGPEPKIFFGNVKTLFTKDDSVTTLTRKFYNQYQNEKIIGLYQGSTPMLLLRDVDLIKKVLVKDFSTFSDRGFSITRDPMNKNLFSLDGDDWKILRQKMSPLFSISKVKQMMPLLNDCAKDYMIYLHKLSEENIPREMGTLNMKYTLKAITSVAFGLDINTFTEKRCEFIEMAETLFKPRSLFHRIVVIIDGIIPGIFKIIPIRLRSKHISNFFLNLVQQAVRERENKPKVRRDFMDLMIELKEQRMISRYKDKGAMELEITDELITAQASLFFAAGFETSSSTMSFLFYELSFNQDVQDRCYEEIKKTMKKYNGELTFEALNDMEYISMVFDETLRKHPVTGVLLRQCVNNYEVPELVTIEKGVKVLISVLAMHYDPNYYPDPEKFDPERFYAGRKSSIKSGTYLPFGDGPRNCIGLRLAKMQSMLGIAHFLYNYRVTICEKTVRKIRYDPTVMILKSIDGIWLNVERRNLQTYNA